MGEVGILVAGLKLGGFQSEAPRPPGWVPPPAPGTAGFQPVASRVLLGLSLEMDVVTPDNNIHFPGLRSWILVFHAILVFISVFIILRFMRF